jgi:hypothetical protein
LQQVRNPLFFVLSNERSTTCVPLMCEEPLGLRAIKLRWEAEGSPSSRLGVGSRWIPLCSFRLRPWGLYPSLRSHASLPSLLRPPAAPSAVSPGGSPVTINTSSRAGTMTTVMVPAFFSSLTESRCAGPASRRVWSWAG